MECCRENIWNEISLLFCSGFNATIEQVTVLHPTVGLSGADPSKVVVDGMIVDEE